MRHEWLGRFRWLGVVLAAALACAGCGDDDGGGGGGDDAGTDATTADGGGDAGPTECVTVATIEGATEGINYPDGITGNGDLAVENGLVRAVFASVEPENRVAQTAASGGTLVDLHYLGQSDHLNELWQLGGTSQLLMVEYTSLTVTEQDEEHALIEARGFVAQRPQPDGTFSLSPDPGEDLEFVTTYEIRCMEPRVRIQSRLTNNTANTYAITGGFQPMDVMFWGRKSLEPFCPNEGQGTECLQFSFADPLGTIVRSPYIGSTGSLTGDPGSFAIYSDTVEQFRGVHSAQLSTIGNFDTGIGLFMPDDSKTWSRVVVVGDGADAASALDVVLDDLAALDRMEVATVTGTVALPDGETLSSDSHARPLVVLATPPESGDATDPETWTPVTTVRVAEDGTFSARVPAGAISYEVRHAGHDPLRGTAGEDAAAGATLDLGTLDVPAAPLLDVEVVDGDGAGIPARVIVVGSGDTPTPTFGSAWGPSPALNTALTDGDGLVSLRLPSGDYDVYATHGIGYSLAHEAVTVGASGASVTLTVEALQVLPDGFLTADFHVHAAPSFDSSLPPEDRVLSYIAEGVDAVVSTEHDVIFDYGPALETVEEGLPPSWQGRLRTFVGVESTQFVPWDSFPTTIGHYNAFPVTATPGDWKNGAPLDEYVDPATLYERLRALPSPVDDPLVQLNHGRSTTAGQIWLGYFDSCRFDPAAAFDEEGHCWMWEGPMGTRPWDIDALEVANGKDTMWIHNLRDWYAILLNAPGGRLPVGTANSDSHALALEGEAGYPVTVLRTDTALADLDDAALVDVVNSGAVAGALGVVVWFELRDSGGTVSAEPGRTPIELSGAAVVDVRVAAPPWVPVEEIRVRVGGQVVARRSAADGDWTEPTDPFGTAGVVRFEDSIDITLPSEDTFVTVEAGVALPRVGDLDGDGRVDATDNDGDDDVDMDDLDAGGIVLSDVPMPFGLVAVGARPFGFTNPVFTDPDGDGYAPAGGPLVD